MSLFGRWRARRRLDREVERAMAELFRSPELLRGTSLSRRHASRWVELDREVTDGELRRICFGIVRHPRPYAFSKQHHEVAEIWIYDVAARTLSREKGFNWTRARGLDSAD